MHWHVSGYAVCSIAKQAAPTSKTDGRLTAYDCCFTASATQASEFQQVWPSNHSRHNSASGHSSADFFRGDPIKSRTPTSTCCSMCHACLAFVTIRSCVVQSLASVRTYTVTCACLELYRQGFYTCLATGVSSVWRRRACAAFGDVEDKQLPQ